MATGSSSTVRTRVRETANGLRLSRNMQTLLIREWATLGREWLHLGIQGIRGPWKQARSATLVDRPTFDSRDLNGCPSFVNCLYVSISEAVQFLLL